MTSMLFRKAPHSGKFLPRQTGEPRAAIDFPFRIFRAACRGRPYPGFTGKKNLGIDLTSPFAPCNPVRDPREGHRTKALSRRSHHWDDFPFTSFTDPSAVVGPKRFSAVHRAG